MGYGPPLVDFSTLGNLATTFNDARTAARKQQLEQNRQTTLASLAGADGNVDPQKAGAALISLGDLDGGMKLLQFGKSVSDTAFSQDQQRQSSARADQSLLLNKNADTRAQEDHDAPDDAVSPQGKVVQDMIGPAPTNPGANASDQDKQDYQSKLAAYQGKMQDGINSINSYKATAAANLAKRQAAADPVAKDAALRQGREDYVKQKGWDPEDPNTQAFVATGKMANQPKDVRASIADSDKLIKNLQNAKAAYDWMLGNNGENNDKAFGGVGSGLLKTYGANLPSFPLANQDSAVATTELDKRMTEQAAPLIKEYFGARPAFAADQVVFKITPDSHMTAAERKAVGQQQADKIEQYLSYETERNKALRGGTYFRPGGFDPNGALGKTAPGAPQAPNTVPVPNPVAPDGSAAARQPLPPGYTPARAMAEAKAAVAAGKDPAPVAQQLRAWGIDPSGL